ncbi:MAG: VOC family protein [Thermoplasmata archaeon]
MKFEYVGVRVRDLDKAIEFYTKVLGLEFLRRRKMEWTGGEIAMLRDPQSGQMLELNWYPKGEYREGDELDHLGFEVDDAEAFLKKLEEAGCEVAYPLEERGSWLYACVADPDGIWIEIYSEKQ